MSLGIYFHRTAAGSAVGPKHCPVLATGEFRPAAGKTDFSLFSLTANTDGVQI